MFTLRHLGPVLAAVSASITLLASPAAIAGVTTVPGTICTLDGAVDRPTNGALLNAAPGSSSTTKMHCPIPHRQGISAYGGTVSVTLNARVNYSYAVYECVLRSVLANGTVFDSTTVMLPPKTSYNNGNHSTGFSVTMPPGLPASVHLRCNVPNIYSSEMAGVISLRIDD